MGTASMVTEVVLPVTEASSGPSVYWGRVHFGAALFRSNLPDSSVWYVGHCKTVRPDIIVHDLGPKILAAERLGTDLN